jgi:hypothetical protein
MVIPGSILPEEKMLLLVALLSGEDCRLKDPGATFALLNPSIGSPGSAALKEELVV